MVAGGPTEQVSHWYLAIDGGGSKGLGVLQEVGPDGQVLRTLEDSQSGSTSAGNATWNLARENLLCLTARLFDRASIGPEQVSHAVLMLAGAGRPTDVERVTRSLRDSPQFAAFERLTVTSDIGPLLHYASDLQPGMPTVVVIGGTGSLVAALDGQLGLLRAGGWGPVLGDQASGFRIGQLGLSHICKWMDRGCTAAERDRIVAQVVNLLSQNNPLTDLNQMSNLASALIATGSDRALTARLAPELLQQLCCLEDDQPSEADFRRQVADQFTQLAEQIHWVLRRLGVDAGVWRLGLAGGLATRDQNFEGWLTRQLDGYALRPTAIVRLDPLTAALSFARRK